MKTRLIVIAALVIFALGASQPAAAQSRYIVRTSGGLNSVLHLCLLESCTVQGSLDGNVGQTYLVTTTTNLLQALVGGVVNLLEALLGIQSVEPDQVLPVPVTPINSTPSGLYDTTPVNYYGSVVTHGYATQPAAQIIRLSDAQNGFGVSGTGIIATIDTGVDTDHPVLQPVLLPGYDFVLNQPGAEEQLSTQDANAQGQQSNVQQSSAAIVEQSSAAIVEGEPGAAYGHGTMTAGVAHLVAPTAKILPCRAFTSDGTGQLSHIIQCLYWVVQNKANVVNMSFDMSVPSQALQQAVSYANNHNVILVAAAGNEDTSNRVYPASLSGNVVGIASTSDTDTRSSFSNYGNADVWIAAPGEYVISTFPGGGFAAASGTSFSAPQVAGTSALMLQLKSGLNQSQASSALSHAHALTPDLNHGRLDAYQALSAWKNAGSSWSW